MGKGIKKALPVVGTVAGGIVGGMYGNPALGASLGGALGTAIAGPELVAKQKAQQVAASPFDIKSEVAPAQASYADLLKSTQAAQQSTTANKAIALNQMGQAAIGQGPSLAEVQMKAAQDRNLSQQLAAVQATRGGNAATNQRALVQGMSAAGRGIAQDAAGARMQERDNFLNQANVQDQALRTDIQGKLALDLMPKQTQQARAMKNADFANQAGIANQQGKNAMTGALMGGVASVAGSYFGGNKFANSGGGGGSTPAPSSGGGTWGSNSIMGSGNMTMPTFKDGGPVEGPGTSTSDSIKAKLSDGEFVVKAKVAKQPAILQVLTKVNKGIAPSKPEMQALAKALSKLHTPKAEAKPAPKKKA